MIGNLTEKEIARTLGIKAEGSLTEGEIYRVMYWGNKELQGKSLTEQKTIIDDVLRRMDEQVKKNIARSETK